MEEKRWPPSSRPCGKRVRKVRSRNPEKQGKIDLRPTRSETSKFYDITHGLGLAILTPRWLKYVLDTHTAPQIKKFGVDVFGIDHSLSDMDGANAAIDALSDFFFHTLGLKSTLTELGIDDSNFSVMAQKACGGGTLHGFKPLNSKDVEAIFRMCL